MTATFGSPTRDGTEEIESSQPLAHDGLVALPLFFMACTGP